MHNYGHAKVCMAIDAYASEVMRSQPQPRESVRLERNPVRLHHTQRDSLATCEKHMIQYLKSFAKLQNRDKEFLLKIHVENHKPTVDGNADH